MASLIIKNFQIKWPITCLLIFYSLILFGPRISGSFRYEDIFTPILLATLLLHPYSKKSLKVSVFFLIYLLFIFLLNFYSYSINNLNILSYVIVIKEFTYYLGYLFTLVILLDNKNNFNNLVLFEKFLFFCVIVASVYGVSAIFIDSGFYGISWISEKAPSLSALIFFNFLVLAVFNYKYLNFNKMLSLLAIFILIFLTFLVGSRSGMLALAVFFSIFFLLSLKPIYQIYLSLVGSIIILTIIIVDPNPREIMYFLQDLNIDTRSILVPLERFSTLLVLLESLEGSRSWSWGVLIEQFYNGNMLFGCGRGCTHLVGETFSLRMAGDTQYLVNLAEIGILGSSLFMLSVISPIFFISKKYKLIWISYFISYAFWAITTELWLITKGAQLFWMFSALCIAASFRDRLKNIET